MATYGKKVDIYYFCFIIFQVFLQLSSYWLSKKKMFHSFSLTKDNTHYHQYHRARSPSTSAWVRRRKQHQDFAEYTVWPKDGNVAVLNSKWVFTDWCLHHKLVTALLCITFPSKPAQTFFGNFFASAPRPRTNSDHTERKAKICREETIFHVLCEKFKALKFYPYMFSNSSF